MGSSVGGIAGGLFGAGNTPSAPNLQTYQLPNLSGAGNYYSGLLQTEANNPYSAYVPQAMTTFNQQFTNPYASGYQAAGNAAGAQYGATGAADASAANAMTGAGNNAMTGANQVLQMGFDPQNALYQRTLQQLNDTVNANEANRGITSSPYGASVANTADSNFNIDWQNNQLTKAIQALGGYTSGVTGANADYSGANTLGVAGAENTSNAGALPFDTSNAITGSQNSALNQLLSIIGNQGAGAWNTMDANTLASYLGLGAQQSNQQANFNQLSYQDALAAAASGSSGIGGLASGFTNGLNSLSGGTNSTGGLFPSAGSYFSNLFGPSTAAAA